MPTALLVTFGAFALILVLARLKVPLAAALLVGTAVLALGFGRRDPLVLADTLWRGLLDPQTLGMVAVVMMLISLSELMNAAGQLQRIVALAGQFLRRPAVAMATLPALIGLIPMPGGAIFSAGMVESAAGKTNVGGAKLSAVNYWFRHIWEFWWPLYPAVIIAMGNLGGTIVTMPVFAGIQVPMMIAMVLAGLPLFRKTHPDLHATAPPPPPGTRRKLLATTSSIWMIFLVWTPVQVAANWLWGDLKRTQFPVQAAMKEFGPVAMGLIATILWTIRLNRMDRKMLAKVFGGRTIYMMALLAAGVMLFQYTVKDVEAAKGITKDLQQLHVPLMLVVAALPLIAGIVTGLGAGFVGSSFPIAIPLAIQIAGGGGWAVAPYVMLAYACGHMGMMVSPMHLCQVVSNRYFKTGFVPVYRQLLAPMLLLFSIEWLYFFLLRALLH